MPLKSVLALFAIAGATIAPFLSGCSSTNSPSPEVATTPRIPASKAAIYLYRDSSPKAGVTMDVWIDGKPLGRTTPTTYVYIEVRPGRHSIVSKASNVDTLVLDAEPGKTYYVFQEADMGTYWATGKLHLVDERVGWSKVQQSWKITPATILGVDGRESE